MNFFLTFKEGGQVKCLKSLQGIENEIAANSKGEMGNAYLESHHGSVHGV